MSWQAKIPGFTYWSFYPVQSSTLQQSKSKSYQECLTWCQPGLKQTLKATLKESYTIFSMSSPTSFTNRKDQAPHTFCTDWLRHSRKLYFTQSSPLVVCLENVPPHTEPNYPNFINALHHETISVLISITSKCACTRLSLVFLRCKNTTLIIPGERQIKSWEIPRSCFHQTAFITMFTSIVNTATPYMTVPL